VIAAISKFIGNPLTPSTWVIFEASYLVIMDETREFLKDKKLLTDELSNAINQTSSMLQNISVTNSRNVNMSGIVNAAQDAAKAGSIRKVKDGEDPEYAEHRYIRLEKCPLKRNQQHGHE
jgi:hypothetical protein